MMKKKTLVKFQKNAGKIRKFSLKTRQNQILESQIKNPNKRGEAKQNNTKQKKWMRYSGAVGMKWKWG